MRKYLALIGIGAALVVLNFGAVPRRSSAQNDAGWLLGQINALRASKGLPGYALNGALTASATGHSQYLATNPWTDAHVESNGSTPRSRIAAAGYSGSVVGENVYGGGMATGQIAFNWWVNSPVHYQGLVNPSFSEVGIGIARGPYGQFFTLDFGGGAGGAPPGPAPAAADHPSEPGSGPTSKPVRRLPTQIPTNTPGPSLTPSLTFTPIPSQTATALPATELPTGTAIVLEVTPQGNPSGGQAMQIVAQRATDAVPTRIAATLIDPAFTLTPTLIPSPVSSVQATSGGSGDMVRTLIPLAIGVQALILGGIIVRRGRQQ